jgi:hypothetical protein
MSSKRKKLNELTIEKKRELIDKYESKSMNQRDLAVKFNISLGSVSNIIKSKNKLMNNESSNINKKMKRITNSDNDDLNNLVLEFINTSELKKIPISGPIIKEFALELANNLHLNNFKASNGWLRRLCNKYDIKFNSYSGEAADVDQELIDNWEQQMGILTEGFNPKDVFNFDETALFIRMMPKKSFMKKGSKYIGGNIMWFFDKFITPI